MNKRASISTALYYGVIVLLPPLLAVSYKNVANVLPLFFIAILGLSFQPLKANSIKKPIAYFFLAFAVYAMLSTLWAQSPPAGLERSLKIILLTFPAIYLILTGHAGRCLNQNIVLKLSIATFIVSTCLVIGQLYQAHLVKDMIFDEVSESSFYAYLNPAVICLSIIYWPILAYTINSGHHRNTKRTLISILTIALLILLYTGKTDTAWVATLVGAASYFWVHFGGKKLILKLIIALSALLVISTSSFLYNKLPIENFQLQTENPYLLKIFESSHLHRLEIWDRCLELIYEKPVFGWGLDASYNLPESDLPSRVQRDSNRSDFLYPHNIFIQCWLEFGIIGLMLMLLWLNALINWASKTGVHYQAAYCASVMAIITVYSFGFHIWRSWWIVFLCVVAVYWCVLLRPEGSDNKM